MICSVVINQKKDTDLQCSRRFLSALCRHPIILRIEEKFKPFFSDLVGQPGTIMFVPDEEIYSPCDFLFVFGGDGSIIKASGKLNGNGTPVVGINLGRVGYLAELEPDEEDGIAGILNGEYRIEERMMLRTFLKKADGTLQAGPDALNDAVIANGSLSRMVDLHLSCDGVPMQGCHGDGLIIATPTGSTAYSMSAGGPILFPTMDCFCITPICSHTLSSRPIVVPASCTIDVTILSNAERKTFLSVDGSHNMELEQGDILSVTQSEHKVRFVRTHQYGFCEILNRKL